MIIIIDGYNLLRQVFIGVKGKLELQRDQFIKQLGYYKKKKAAGINSIIVVFDSGPFNHATREVKRDVVVVFSGQKNTADDWIIDFVDRHKGEDILLVTMDRALSESCKKLGAITIKSLDFYALMQNALLEKLVQVEHVTMYKKYEHEDDFNEHLDQCQEYDQSALDLLMEQASICIDKKPEDEHFGEKTTRRGAAMVPSKKDKKVLARLKKL